MKLKRKEYTTIALISGIIGYLLHGYFSLGNLEAPLINSLWLFLSFLIGLLGGSDILGFLLDRYKKRKEKHEEEQDKDTIYNWLHDKTKHLILFNVGTDQLAETWPSTVEISSAIDLTEERVKYICTIDKRIQRQEKSDLWQNQKLEERWAIRKFVRN